ncbi:hypothetical protein [Stackebrandtia nassauensis]|uniref:Uncharacterized protein n=1 Tax=Stackebrandtia nassauensis (strain DSM 44728 / CIP 108903 / NRRL B-16338 / NBRC 102104 / LLR-40K-21) TaxID=446470 RepID=D3PWM8_STANL|nr:hypothetical protein [Stackebrandtia nassauensis]ADD43250.1 hypothetical protein Snas_3590 [Stackebrandtia nassauensis DSM 44728]
MTGVRVMPVKLRWGDIALLGLIAAAIVRIGLTITLVSTRGRVGDPD